MRHAASSSISAHFSGAVSTGVVCGFDGLEAAASRSQRKPWTSLQSLASELFNAVRHPIDGASVGRQSGLVQQQSPALTSRVQDADLFSSHVANAAQACSGIDVEDVQKEPARVASRSLSSGNSNEVILRFDFINSRDTRVKFGYMLCKRLASFPLFVRYSSCRPQHSQYLWLTSWV